MKRGGEHLLSASLLSSECQLSTGSFGFCASFHDRVVQFVLQIVWQLIELVVAIDFYRLARGVVSNNTVITCTQVCAQVSPELLLDVMALKQFVELCDELSAVHLLAPSAVASFVDRK
jgi:hypothetical protein